MSEIGDWSSATPAKYTSYNLVRQEMRERSDKSDQQPTYTIKPPVWRGVWYGICLDCAGFSSSVWLEGGTWFARCSGLPQPFGTEAAAREWCEARYYEWVRQFLEEVKT